MTFRHVLIAFAAISFATLAVPSVSLAQDLPKPREIKSIAEEALIYGLPMVMGYGVMYQYAIDDKSANYKAPFNQIYNEAHTFTPADTGVVTPNADTPFSFAWMDLRAEPIVICVPKIEKDRYFSVMLTSLYTYNFGYLGSRTTGNGAEAMGGLDIVVHSASAMLGEGDGAWASRQRIDAEVGVGLKRSAY